MANLKRPKIKKFEKEISIKGNLRPKKESQKNKEDSGELNWGFGRVLRGFWKRILQ